jgi:glutathione S-transferase
LKFGSIEARPAFQDYWGPMEERAAYRRATALDDAAMPPQQG